MAYLLLLLMITGPQPQATHFDLIEVNHMYSLNGDYIFSQVILWRRDPATQKLHVGHWELLEPTQQAPVKRYGVYRYRSRHGDSCSSAYRESWTQADPERANKKIYPEECRIGFPALPKE